MVYRTKAHHFYKPNPKHEKIRTFWKIYRTVKMIIGIVYDASSVILVLMSFDKVYKFKSWRVVKPWQIAMLVQKIPKLTRSLRHHLTYGI